MKAAPPATLAGAREALQRGSWAAEELCEAALDRAQATAALNAFVRLESQHALAAAAAADRRRGQAGGAGAMPALPVLNGIPLAHKDLFYRPDRAPGCGSRAPAPARPGQEATVLARLAAAGSVDLGTLHLSEFAYGPTGHNAALGPAHNPFDPDHASGGSSSGSAVAVATGVAYASLGSDTGGSIRTPASWCGVTGLKPTRGAIPLTGVMALAPSMDTVGVMARTAEDVATVLAVVAGADGRDPASQGAPVFDLADVQRALGMQARLGVVDAWFDEDLSAAVAAALDKARGCWAAELGARVVAARFPGIRQAVANARAVLLREAWHTHEPLLERHDHLYSPAVRARLLAGSAVEPAEWQAALREMPALLQQLLEVTFRDADVLLMPCNPTTAPRIDATDPGAAADLTPTVLRQVDAITRCLRPLNYLGVPSLVLPAGVDAHGLPIGLQLVGRPWQEATLLALGRRWQAHTDWHRRSPKGVSLAWNA